MAEVEESVQIIKGQNVIEKMVLTKLNTDMAYHFRPLFVQGNINRVPIPRIMMDNDATVNILSTSMRKRLGKSIDGLMSTVKVVNSFTGRATMDHREEADVVRAIPKPFVAGVHAAEAVCFYDNIGPHRIIKNKLNDKQEVAKIMAPIATKE
ncbi:hypothetical protein ACH5RR_008643 [Cinchona calisaya]|uniref:Uncharacterized protein n=1 Tax=Cinchona calisaya TaxID=153742 RepID=A0ABD3ABY1_9GENT